MIIKKVTFTESVTESVTENYCLKNMQVDFNHFEVKNEQKPTKKGSLSTAHFQLLTIYFYETKRNSNIIILF